MGDIKLTITLSEANSLRVYNAFVKNMGWEESSDISTMLLAKIQDFIWANVQSYEETMAIEEFRSTYEPEPFIFEEEPEETQ